MESWREELYHYGIEGQRWGIRRFQNKDGTLTEEGKKRYGENAADDMDRISNLMEDYSSIKNENKAWKENIAEGAAVAGLAGALSMLFIYSGNMSTAAIEATAATLGGGAAIVSGVMAAKGSRDLKWVKNELNKNGIDPKEADKIYKEYTKAMKKANKDYARGRTNESEYIDDVSIAKAYRNKSAQLASIIRKSGMPLTSDDPKPKYPIKDADRETMERWAKLWDEEHKNK